MRNFLKKLQAKGFIEPVAGSRRYRASPDEMHTIAALVVLRGRVIKPILAGTAAPKPEGYTAVDAHDLAPRTEMLALFADLGPAAA